MVNYGYWLQSSSVFSEYLDSSLWMFRCISILWLCWTSFHILFGVTNSLRGLLRLALTWFLHTLWNMLGKNWLNSFKVEYFTYFKYPKGNPLRKAGSFVCLGEYHRPPPAYLHRELLFKADLGSFGNLKNLVSICSDYVLGRDFFFLLHFFFFLTQWFLNNYCFQKSVWCIITK